VLIDEDPQLTHVLSYFLSKHGFRTEFFNDSPAAWKYMQSNRDGISLLIADWGMSFATLQELLDCMNEKKMGIPVIITSASIIYPEIVHPKEENVRVLLKPFTSIQLLSCMESVMTPIGHGSKYVACRISSDSSAVRHSVPKRGKG
jgi:DNA-binding NtrC family response regulator